jgi:hypothetical protein
VTRTGALSLAGAAAASVLLWLVLGTQQALPSGHRDRAEWSGDYHSYYLPNAEYAGSRLARGELPLWNPQPAAGVPFLATLQTGVLYPPTWLHALWPGAPAFLLLACLHIALAAVSAGGLAMLLGAGAGGGAVSGVAYATSLQVVGSVWSPPVLYTAAWTPAIFLGVEAVLRRPSPRRCAALAGSLGLALLAGWPYGVAIGVLGAGLYSLLRLTVSGVRERRLPLRPTLGLAAALAVGVLLAAPQLLPTFELLERSCRALGSLVERQAVFVDRPHDPALVFGALLRRGFNDAVPGVVSLLLLPAALKGPATGRMLALLAVGLFGLLASFPGHVPVYGWLRELPVLGDFRFPFRYRQLTALALAVAAGVGTRGLAALLAARGRPARWLAPAVLAVLLATATLPVLRSVRPFARRAPTPRPLALELEALGAGIPGGEGRVFWAGRSDRLRASPGWRVLHDMEPLSLARVARMLTFFEVGRPLTVTGTASRSGRPSGDTLAAPFYGRVGLPPSGTRADVLDLFSVATVVSEDPPPWLSRRYRRLSPHGAAPVAFANPAALPRAFRVRAALREPEQPAVALARIVSPGFDPRRVAYLDDPPTALRLAPGTVPPRATGEVRIVIDDPEHVALATRGPHPAAVVVTDAWYPGWEASVDGEPAALLRANLAFRAVAVPPGPHRVELHYRPASLRRGLVLSVVGLAACGLALARGRGTGARGPAGRVA